MPICSQCGSPLGDGKLAGLCPQCMLLGTLADEPEADSNSLNPPEEPSAAPAFPTLNTIPLARFGD